MAILVDPAVWPRRGRLFAHLVSDRSYDELHAFAAGLGLQRRWFQGDHYDVPSEVRAAAIELGAEPVSAAELVRRLRAAGLRQRSRVSRLPGEPLPGSSSSSASVDPGEAPPDRQSAR